CDPPLSLALHLLRACSLRTRPPPRSTLFPYTTLFRSVHFKEGQEVKERDVLVTLDDRALRAQLAQSEATLERDRASLQRARLERSEEHTSELQSLTNLVCRLLLEKTNATSPPRSTST